jgi:hypothetical protein
MTIFTPLDIDDAFDDYMRSVLPGCKETEIQYRESHRVWHAAMRRLLVHMRDQIPNVSDDEGVVELENLFKQGEEYWNRAMSDKD